MRDPAPAFYAYRMTDTDGSVTLGALGVLGLDEASAAEILPHEETLPKAKSDRLELLDRHPGQPVPHLGAVAGPGLTALLATDSPPRRVRAR